MKAEADISTQNRGLHPDIAAVLEGRSQWCVVTGDCLAVLPTIPAGCVDLCLTDPPFGDTSCVWDDRVGGWADQLDRLLKPSGSAWVWCSLRYFRELLREFDRWTQAQDIVWEKHNGSSFHADRFKRVHEHAVQFYRGAWADVYKRPQFTQDATARTVRRKARPPHTGHIDAASYESLDGGPRLMRSVLQCRSCHGEAEHPTQKPVGVLSPLVEFSCPPGGIVLDCFAGVGSVGVACAQNGRRCISIELDPVYAAIARRRIADACPLFVPPPAPEPARLFTEGNT